jgi:hypothetical protein
VLSRRDREGRIDLPSELRLLELYVKYSGASTKAPLAPSEPASQARETPRWRGPPPRPSRQHNYIDPMVIVMSVSFMLIAMLIS